MDLVTIIFIIILIFLLAVLVFTISGMIFDDPTFIHCIIYKFLIRKPYIFIKNVLCKFFGTIYKVFLRGKIKKIIKEIDNNEDFKSCFDDIDEEVKSWNVNKIHSWTLEKGYY